MKNIIKKLKDKFDSIDSSIHIYAMIIWIILTVSLILLKLTVSELYSSSKVPEMWSITSNVIITGVALFLGVLIVMKGMGGVNPILFSYLMLIIIITDIGKDNLLKIIIFMLVTYITNIFTAYLLAKKIVNYNKGDLENLFTKTITKISTSYMKEGKKITEETTTEKSPMGTVVLTIIVPIIISLMQLLVLHK